MGKRSVRVMCAVAVLVGALAGCRAQASDDAPLRIAVLPIIDTLPVYVAQQEGYFADEGIQVEIVPVSSSPDRDQLLQAKQIDGGVTDLPALVLYNRDSVNVIAVRYGMVPTASSAEFSILASGKSSITSPEDLRGVPIGVSEGTVIEYVTYRLLTAEGLDPSDIKFVGVPRIPERMALLSSGEVAAAMLQEPLSVLAIQQGARVVIDDRTHPEYSCSIFVMRADVIRDRGATVAAFVRAFDRASAAINADKTRWSGLLSEQSLVPASLQADYVPPELPESSVPTQAQFADVVAWLKDKGQLTTDVRYEDVVTDAYVQH